MNQERDKLQLLKRKKPLEIKSYYGGVYLYLMKARSRQSR